MSDRNKYRFKVRPKSPFKTERFERLEALEQITKWRSEGVEVTPVKFSGRKISAAHRKALMECARLWDEIEGMERVVSERQVRGRHGTANRSGE